MKKVICIILTLMFVFNIPFSGNAVSYVPTITSPTQYEEVTHRKNVTVTWSAPNAGTVTKYLLSLRELKVGETSTNRLILNQVNITSSQRTYTISASSFVEGGFYRLALGAVVNGTAYWVERLFYVSLNRGVRNRTISLRIYNGFSTEIKNAIYYSAQTWYNATGVERVNTYSFSSGVDSSTLIKEDGINTVVPYTDHLDNRLMVTHIQRDSSYSVEEVDITVNRAYVWVVGSQSGCYDVQNVMTHEIGHALGLCDKYETFSSEWTMYGSSSGGETKKRTLTTNDIQAVTQLYA